MAMGHMGSGHMVTFGTHGPMRAWFGARLMVAEDLRRLPPTYWKIFGNIHGNE